MTQHVLKQVQKGEDTATCKHCGTVFNLQLASEWTAMELGVCPAKEGERVDVLEGS